jgi:hypothetical protein
MLHATGKLQNWKARWEFSRVADRLSGRARYEPGLTWRAMNQFMRRATDYRVTGIKNRYTSSITVQRFNAAAMEHGTHMGHIQKDQARHRMGLSNIALVNLAQYEPLSFRSVVELCASEISPPKPLPDVVPSEVRNSTTVADQLRKDVQRFLYLGSLRKDGPLFNETKLSPPEKLTESWLNAAEEFRAPTR